MNKKAKLFGFIPFDAFNEKSIRRVKWVLRIIPFLLAALIYLAVDFIILNIFANNGSLDIIDFIFSGLTITMGLWLFIYLLFNTSKLLFIALNKINADHLLKEFDKNINRGSLKTIAKKDIKTNGYFSASGYLLMKEKLAYYNDNSRGVKQRNLKNRHIEEKYPDLFDSSNETK